MVIAKGSLKPYLWIVIFLSIFSSINLHGQAGVKIWEAPLVIPTYRVGEPEKNPIFHTGRAYQGAKGPVYPYPMLDKLTDSREDKTYQAVFLENEHIKLCVLPEIGGRIFYALDKTNGYDLFYRQHVIKPALIGILGAWISGGVEWCIPHHHRATTFMEVDHAIQENDDGSKTVWIGEMELRHRMKWIIGLTLYPDQSIIEATVKFFNRTPFLHSFLYWANVAVHANPDYQVIFPPSTEFGTHHGKNQFTRWPLSSEYYGGVDYTRGVNLSWWKHLPSPTSIFAWDCEEDFLAGYDHGKEAGVVHVADHHVVPGKKLWTWGTGSPGKIWEKILTETDGPYLEIMVGAYSDNQPDYSWIQPYEVKTFRQVWYPLREIGGVKNAHEKAAVNLEITEKSAKLGFNTTSDYTLARVVLRAAEETLFEKTIAIGPDKPFSKEIRMASDIGEKDLEALLISQSGDTVISYTPVNREKTTMPEPVKRPSNPQEIETVEELYLAGSRLEQFYNPVLEPYPYYEEALKRDPDDVRVNTALGILLAKRGLFQDAEKHLKRAVNRAAKSYTRPRRGESLYYLGVVLRAQNKMAEAYEAFARAAWDAAFHSAAHYQLGELACNEGNMHLALDHLARSLSTNQMGTRALNLKTVILRHIGKIEEAERTISEVMAIDPLNFWGGNEIYLIRSKQNDRNEAHRVLNGLQESMKGSVQSYLELAVDYGNCGFLDEAIDVISRFMETGSQTNRDDPLFYYYLGFYWERKGEKAKALQYYRRAQDAPPDYCFPFRLETLEMLGHVSTLNPQDSRAHFYLGNLLYDLQPEKALKAWERSRALDDTFGMVHRNLGLAYSRIRNDVPKAVASLERAVELSKNDPKIFYEMDLLYQMGGVDAEKRLSLLEENHDTIVLRDDALSREVLLLVQLGRYDRAIDLLTNHHFHTWEGGGQIHNVYVHAYQLRGLRKVESKSYHDALEDFQAALEYPENLEVGRPIHDRKAYKTNYFIGKTHEALGQNRKARGHYLKAADTSRETGWSEILFYQGLALQQLGKSKDAELLFDRLIRGAEERLERETGMDFFTKFGEKQSQEKQRANAFYLLGLGCLGKGRTKDAETAFGDALRLDQNHLWARRRK